VNEIIFLVNEPPEGGYAAESAGGLGEGLTKTGLRTTREEVGPHFDMSADDVAARLFS